MLSCTMAISASSRMHSTVTVDTKLSINRYNRFSATKVTNQSHPVAERQPIGCVQVYLALRPLVVELDHVAWPVPLQAHHQLAAAAVALHYHKCTSLLKRTVRTSAPSTVNINHHLTQSCHHNNGRSHDMSTNRTAGRQVSKRTVKVNWAWCHQIYEMVLY